MINNNSYFSSNNGIIKFYDGTVIAIEIREYSSDGMTNWELRFNPMSHTSTLDGITILDGHLYTRVKHTGDTNFQLPYRIVPKEPVFIVENGILQWKFIEEDDSEYRELIDAESLKGEDGEQGIQGIQGEGLDINRVGYFLTKPDCCSGLTASTSCVSCNPNSSTSVETPYLFLSLGDGAREIVLADVGKYKRCDEALPWIEILNSDIGSLCRYIANDDIGTGTLDYNTMDDLLTRGKVYICADGKWTLFNNLQAPTYMVQEEFGSTHIAYLDSFTTTGALAHLIGTVGLSNGKLEVIAESITEAAFNQTAFGDGIEILNPQDKPKVNVSDFIGFGLKEYVSDIDSENDIQVFVDDVIGDGLISYDDNANQTDGEDRNLARVNVDDLISPTTGISTGLETSTDAGITETDAFDNIYVKPGTCILVDIDGVNVKADELAIIAAGLTELTIKPYIAGNDGVMAIHLNPNVADADKGLEVDNSTGIFIKHDTLRGSTGFNVSGELHIPDNGIQGVHLNDNTCNNLAGIAVLNDLLTVKVDTTSINFNMVGELEISPTFITDTMEGLVVTNLTYAGVDMVGDITLTTVTNDTYGMLNLNATATHNVAADDILNLILDFDEVVFETTVKSLIDLDHIENRLESILHSSDGSVDVAFDDINNKVDLTIASSTAIPSPAVTVNAINGNAETGSSVRYALEDHRHAVEDNALNQSSIINLITDLAKKLELDIAYGNITIKSTGLWITSSGGTVQRRLIMDDSGNLDTSL